MTGNRNKTSLYQRLKDSQVEYPLIRQQKFLPLNILDEAITEENVKTALRGRLYLFSNRRHLSKIVEQAKKIFAILVDIGEPDAIKDLLSEGLTDEDLPLYPKADSNNVLVSQSGKAFQSFANWKTEQRVADFVDKQWIVLAPVLDSSGKHVELDPRCPLPFREMDPVGGGPSSTVYKSELHPAHYRGPKLYDKMHQVAAKEFRNVIPFRREKDNLDTIQKLNHEHLIKHLATYQKDTLYYVIFPWANGGSLRDFWEHEDACSRDTKVTLWSLRQMLGLAEALEALHSVNCRHGDLKPENILHFREMNEGKLIVADVGVSRSHEQDTQFRHVGTTTRATTPSYEAPEAFTDHSAPRARRYDIWSLGCVFLEFAIWLLHDFEAINSFGHARHAPLFEFYLLNRYSSASNRKPEIHPMVTRAIELLRQDIRCKGDTAFGALVNLIAERLLRVEVDKRASADEVVEKLRKIIRDVEATPSYLFNSVHPPSEKLRFPRRAQTGAYEPSNGIILE